MGQILDGLSNTLLAGETRVHLSYMDAPAPSSHAYWGDNESCFNTGWADDVVRFVTKTPALDLTDPAISGSLAHQQFGSSHPSGIQTVFCDGSVHTIDFYIAPNVFRWLGQRHDGNTVSLDY